MALNIKDGQTDRLARALAQETGESITVATRIAVEERLARVRARRRGAPSHAQLQAIAERGRRRASLDSRTAEAIVGYDQHGVPT